MIAIGSGARILAGGNRRSEIEYFVVCTSFENKKGFDNL